MSIFIDQFEKNPEMDIPASFLEQLQNYEKYVEEYDIKVITKDYDFIPKNIEKIVNNPYLCAEMQVCDLVINVLFKFITVRGTADSPAIWASKLLKKIASQREVLHELRISSKTALKAVQTFPSEYVRSLPDKSLNILSLSSPPSFLTLPILEEFDKRNLELPLNLITHLDFSNPLISPHLLLTIFDLFIREPNMLLAENLVKAIKNKPQIHLLFMRDLSPYEIGAVEEALQILGTAIIRELPFPFQLSALYSPKISDLVDEIEANIETLERSDRSILVSILQSYSDSMIGFILPLLLEFPQWKSLLTELDDRLNISIS